MRTVSVVVLITPLVTKSVLSFTQDWPNIAQGVGGPHWKAKANVAATPHRSMKISIAISARCIRSEGVIRRKTNVKENLERQNTVIESISEAYTDLKRRQLFLIQRCQ